MPRAIWSGAISFGLVNIPIKLVTAVDRKNVSFREIRRTDSSRIRHRKVAANDGQEVTTEEVVKGFEVAPDRYVVIDPDELKALNPKASKTIEIEDFVELSDIDPIYYDSSYYLVPAQTAAKPYELLRRSMLETGKAAIARFVLRTKQYRDAEIEPPAWWACDPQMAVMGRPNAQLADGYRSPMPDETNALIENNRRIVERSRTQVGNLAHSLKTPLAVLINEGRALGGSKGTLISEQAQAMREQVDHYLTRARMAALPSDRPGAMSCGGDGRGTSTCMSSVLNAPSGNTSCRSTREYVCTRFEPY
jgi:signal transduction histidine kinase